LSSHSLRAIWNGGDGKDAVTIDYALGGDPRLPAVSHFGHGILTWQIPFLFRTPPGWQLLVRGPANMPKDGVYALEGIVETDWAIATFTMNWKFTRPGLTVAFDVGEPICMVIPHRCGDLESVEPRMAEFDDAPELQRQHDMWSRSRAKHLAELNIPGSEAAKRGWQKHYFRGEHHNGASIPAHRTTLRLRDFAEHSGVCEPDIADAKDDDDL
jgi:uncharacterized protein DUF6065